LLKKKESTKKRKHKKKKAKLVFLRLWKVSKKKQNWFFWDFEKSQKKRKLSHPLWFFSVIFWFFSVWSVELTFFAFADFLQKRSLKKKEKYRRLECWWMFVDECSKKIFYRKKSFLNILCEQFKYESFVAFKNHWKVLESSVKLCLIERRLKKNFEWKHKKKWLCFFLFDGYAFFYFNWSKLFWEKAFRLCPFFSCFLFGARNIVSK
jgi:hypothetical protein